LPVCFLCDSRHAARSAAVDILLLAGELLKFPGIVIETEALGLVVINDARLLTGTLHERDAHGVIDAEISDRMDEKCRIEGNELDPALAPRLLELLCVIGAFDDRIVP